MDDADFRKKLNPEQYRVMRQKGTEVAYTGRYFNHDENGVYTCAACSNPVFTSLDKFDSKNGWPAFHGPMLDRSIVIDKSTPGETQVRCASCDSHLGYWVGTDDNRYFQINSIGLSFVKAPELQKDDGKGDGKKNDVQNSAKPSSGASSLVKNISLLSAGGVVGAAAIAVVVLTNGTTLLCQNTSMIAPTTTAPIVTPRPIVPATNPVTSVPPRTVPPRATTSSATLGSPATGAAPNTPSPVTGEPAATDPVTPETGTGVPAEEIPPQTIQ